MKEFFAKDQWPNTLVPETSRFRKFLCWATGGHNWCKFLWGGIDHPFDCDSCSKCFKFRGPMPLDRDIKTFPCRLRDD